MCCGFSCFLPYLSASFSSYSYCSVSVNVMKDGTRVASQFWSWVQGWRHGSAHIHMACNFVSASRGVWLFSVEGFFVVHTVQCFIRVASELTGWPFKCSRCQSKYYLPHLLLLLQQSV